MPFKSIYKSGYPLLKKGLYFTFLIYFLNGCTAEQLPSDNKIRLHYYYHTKLPDKSSLTTGLKWILSYLGASLQSGQTETAVVWKTDPLQSPGIIELDLSKAGFSEAAETALQRILSTIKGSSSYREKNYTELGRFVTLTFNSSHHYYSITGAHTSFDAFKAAYNFEDTSILQLIPGNSSVTTGSRVLYQTSDTVKHFLEMAFYAIEGTGDISQGTFAATDIETFDFMPNGQPRFAVYDANGIRKAASPSNVSIAGKPAKCMWCHESSIQPNFGPQQSIPLIQDFNTYIYQQRQFLDSIRNPFPSDLNFQHLQEHSKAELLYILFMEPSAERLSLEWNYTLAKTQELLKPWSTHLHIEYPDLGQLYYRDEIDHLGPHTELRVPGSAKEESDYEPNF